MFCNSHDNAYLYDPSVLLKINNSLFDGDTHFSDIGHRESFRFIYDTIIQNTLECDD